MRPTYYDVIHDAKELEKQARTLASLAHEMWWSTLEPEHVQGCEPALECGMELFARLQVRADVLMDWVRALEESIGEHRVALEKQAEVMDAR
jgi:hypothetical protein